MGFDVGSGPLHVLVADDERHIVRLIKVNLERQGHLVRTAGSLTECLEKLREALPDLLVVDGDFADEALAAAGEIEGFAGVRVIPLRSG